VAGNKWGAKIEKNHCPENFIKQLCDNYLRKFTLRVIKGIGKTGEDSGIVGVTVINISC
jgi:hypothetical protein